ncbi:hypothetical protein AWN76_015485 [Rhodothermaceae bacterium RA]|nr:hypothetical protein AWN76_015485 [Rhodothermaceae bacterium RA]
MNLRDRLRESVERLRLRFALHDVERRSPILVYQMGKVGSSTVTRTLAMLGLSEPVLHLHTLNPETLRRAVERQRASVRPRLNATRYARHFYAEELEAFQDRWRRRDET